MTLDEWPPNATRACCKRHGACWFFQYYEAYLPLTMSHSCTSSTVEQKTDGRHTPLISCPLEPQHKSVSCVCPNSAIP